MRIEHPDLPEGVKTAAGELVASLWTQAQAAAQEGLVVFRSEAQAAAVEARVAPVRYGSKVIHCMSRSVDYHFYFQFLTTFTSLDG